MANEVALLDTGPLVALIHVEDPYHGLTTQSMASLKTPLLTCWPVLTEAAWLLRSAHNGVEGLLRYLQSDLIRPLDLDERVGPWLQEFYKRYRDLRPQLADACLCYLAERENIRTVFTLDRRDFSVIVDRHGKAFHLVPEELA